MRQYLLHCFMQKGKDGVSVYIFYFIYYQLATNYIATIITRGKLCITIGTGLRQKWVKYPRCNRTQTQVAKIAIRKKEKKSIELKLALATKLKQSWFDKYNSNLKGTRQTKIKRKKRKTPIFYHYNYYPTPFE